MRITDVIIEKIHIDLLEPFKIAFAELDYTENVLIKITTDEGYTGYGEAAPFAPVTGETIEGTLAVLKTFREGLIGMDPMDLEKVHEMMDGLILHNGSSKCAVDIALHDIRGKVMNQPLYKVLGGYQSVVQNDITIGISTPEKMAEKAKQYVSELGYRILKIKAGINAADDIKTMMMIREAVGPDIRIRVDANQGYDVSKAVYALNGMKAAGVEAVEQCLPYWDFDGSAFLRSKIEGIQIMLDESIHTPIDAARAAKTGAADILNIKLMKCGGLYRAGQISTIAENFGMTCMVGCMLETKIAITAGISMVASRKNITEADCDSFMYYKDSETGMTGGFTRDRDLFTLLEKPGLGIEINF